jgi:hypothetical protein
MANRGLEGRINQIASRPTDPNLDQKLDWIRTAEAIRASENGRDLIPFLDRLMANRNSLTYSVTRHVMNLQVRIARAKSDFDGMLVNLAGHLTSGSVMEDLIKALKAEAVWNEQVANPRRLALLGAISSMKGLPGTTTSHITDPRTGAVLERNAAGGPTALIAQFIGKRGVGSVPHIHTTAPPPGPPEHDDLYDGGRRRTRRRRHR